MAVGDALKHAHRLGYVHRDIKPSNILVDRLGRVRLTDFDLVWSESFNENLTTGTLGTFVYAAPEQFRPGEGVTPSRDTYSLAMTAAFALYGEQLAPVVLLERERFIEELPIGAALKRVLHKALDLNPEERYGDMSTFCEELSFAWLE